MEGFPPAALKPMPQGLSWDGKVKHQNTFVPFLRNTHMSVTQLASLVGVPSSDHISAVAEVQNLNNRIFLLL